MLHNASYTYAYFFWILSPIKTKFGQVLVCCMTNISNMFLAECWRLETSSRFFYDFIKMTIQQDLAIFNDWHIPFLIVLYSPFQKNETLESWHIWLLSNWDRLLIEKDLESSPSLPNCSKDYWKLLYLLISINWPSLVTSWFVVRKIYSKTHVISCTNTHCDVTDLVNHWMVENTKTWISWERNIIFLRNKKILNLCVRWHILRSYCFVAEVTFK